MTNKNLNIRLGYRLQNGTIQRNSARNTFPDKVTLDLAMQAAEKNINETKDILLWNEHKLRAFEISDQMIPFQHTKSQFRFVRELTSQLGLLHVWVEEFNQKIYIQTRPISCPKTPEEAVELIDYIESLAYIIKLLKGAVVVNLADTDRNTIKFIKALDKDLKTKLLLYADGSNHLDVITTSVETGIKLCCNLSSILEYYSDRVIDFDPLEWWLKRTTLIYLSPSRTSPDGSIPYLQYAKIRKEIYYGSNECDIIVNSPLKEIACQDLLRKVALERPIWRCTIDKHCC